jgi:ERCC4-type nuclease
VLDIGDVQISISTKSHTGDASDDNNDNNDNNNNNDTSQNDDARGNSRANLRTYTFERKTLEDLEASVKDGRYHEQKKRAQSNGIALTYILEGSFSYSDKNASNKMLTGCVINTMMRDKIPIIFTKNLEETAAFLDCFLTRVNADPSKYMHTQMQNMQMQMPYESSVENAHANANANANAYVGTICLKKKENVDPATCYILQLACIPGISKTKAQSIATHHSDIKSMSDLCGRLKGQKPEKFFKDTPGVGKGIAKAIYTFCGIDYC